MKHICRSRRLTPEEAAKKYKMVREQVERELHDLIAQHHVRLAFLDQLREKSPILPEKLDPL